MRTKFFIFFAAAIFMLSCSTNIVKLGEIRIKGSDTMFRLNEKLADAYMKSHPGISIHVEGGGTKLGFLSLIKNEIDICSASRNVEPHESEQLSAKYMSVGVGTFIGRDAVCIYVNKYNPINNLKLMQLKEIFLGIITNWKELAGEDKPIIPIIRNDYSGTVSLFKNLVLEENNFSGSSNVVSNVEEVLEKIETDPYAIGFSGLRKVDCKIISIDGYYPSEENIKNGNYPLSRYLYFYTIDIPKGEVKEFIDWVLESEGQSIVKDEGFIPLFEDPF